MERLEELDLSGLSIHGASPLLSRLKVLRLNYLGEGTGATTAHILTVLAQCPELTDLQVSNCDIHDPEAPDLPARLELPHLRVLSFRNNTPSGASSSLLSRISTPKYDRFCLDTHYATGLPSHQLLESISHVVPSLAHLVASARCVVIDLDDYRCRYSAHHSSMGQTLELSVDHSSPLTVLGWITTVFGNAMKTVRAEVTICYDSSESPPDSCLPAISRIPLMTSLTLMGQDDQTPIIQHLSTATLVNGKQQWPFPRLASLSIEEDANDPGAILGMVESRYGHTIKSKKAKSKARLPAPFTSFVISGSGKTMDDHTYRQIRKIVGDDNVRREIEEDEEDEDDDYYYGGGCRYGPHSDDEAMSFSDEGYY
ncbi:hypothetical protein FRB99_002879 [Tulasnella sp. 403]|nr:hypothetical protein FRB99_002879 [Tulasnella sp. 403]